MSSGSFFRQIPFVVLAFIVVPLLSFYLFPSFTTSTSFDNFYSLTRSVPRTNFSKISMKCIVPVDKVCTLITRESPIPKSGEALVQIYATALNRADTLIRKGLYPGPKSDEPEILGLELAGVIVGFANGGSKLGFAVGDRVMALVNNGGYAEYAAVDENMLMKVADNLSLYEAGGIPETWLTSYQLLYMNAALKKGDTVLIHAASSGIGTTAAQLCQGVGATCYGTVGSEEKASFCKKLGMKQCFNRKEGPWAPKLIEKIQEDGGNGVNIVIDPVGASYVEQNLQALTTDSTWVLFGLMGGAALEPSSTPFLGAILRKRIKLCGTTLKTRSLEYKVALTKALVNECEEKWITGEYRPILDVKSFALENAQEAHEYMESNQNIGKIILKVKEDATEEAIYEKNQKR